MKENYIKRVELKGIHNRYDLEIDFNESLNILYGKNGTGKSTLIHIIANIANCDFIRFAFLKFISIKVIYSNDAHVCLTQVDENNEDLVIIETDSGAKCFFGKIEAFETFETLNLLTDDRYSREHEPALIKKLAQFVKENNIRHIETSYFPAFRTMLEAWSSQRENNRMLPRRVRDIYLNRITNFSRELFGEFLPDINYPSPIEIERSLRNEIRDQQIRVARYESSVFSDSFVKVFSALLEGKNIDVNADHLLQEISQLTAESTSSKLGDLEENSNAYRELQALVNKSATHGDLKSASGALAVYRDALKERQSFQQNAFKEIDTYFEVVNSFLDKKELSYSLDKNKRIPRVGLKFPDGTWSPIRVMSSGERQLLTMLYAVTRMSRNSAVLIDEPEISLHIDWQEDLLEKMMKQLGNRQIIVCTHSPAIAADFDEYMKEVSPIFISSSKNDSDFLSNEEDDF
ncbi:AAA family ATPase [Xenorhabdus bovienii]|uniref:AAA family ATPase n=1 Tax=Xenorhabdus bovienii TaxID=40576 RepID=A0AAJ1N554_XENBV|nr:AAA family ATPase [Xenorhabdus bovienii]MDE1479396.1 AAA family ATPase [Xenorhabdus bovienii]MDE9467094.1 AAA family ATPase [Xenorhabdus bovienii]MDE9511138.1 AAA family ATPase [Xenorhabdus bovienii]MDE9522795.1 AAA family ATPase [Xenorhabdus bovienii]